jgi:ABC-2 type transport system permease protein
MLVIALTHDLLAAERDSSRLGLLRLQGGAMGGLVIRRLLVRMCWPVAIVSLAVLVAMSLGVAASVAVVWWLIATAYVLLWGMLGCLVSVRARSAQSAAAVLLSCWLGVVVILPAALALMIESLAPMPSRLGQITAMREVQLNLQQRTSQLLERFLVDHPELAGGSGDGFARSSFLAQRETEAQLAPVLSSYEDARSSQRTWLSRLMWISPAMLTHATLTHVAGTDGARHAAYKQQVNEFADAWRAHLRDSIFLGRTLSAEEVGALPRFKFIEPGASGAAVAVAYLSLLIFLASLAIARSLRAADLR